MIWWIKAGPVMERAIERLEAGTIIPRSGCLGKSHRPAKEVENEMELEGFMPGGKQRVKSLTIYAKNETEDIPTHILREIKKVLEKGNEILDRRYLKGVMPPKMVRVKE